MSAHRPSRSLPRPAVLLASITVMGAVMGPVMGCHKAPAETATAESDPATTPLTEEGDNGTVAWNVTTDGQVRAVVKTTDGRQVTKDVSGTITWPGDAGDQVRDVSLDDKGNVVAAGPALEEDLTEIDYALEVEGKPWTGVLHVPRGGTRALEEDAQASSAVVVPAGKTGPNGGVIQVINGDRVEVVADRDTEEVRVYMLGPDLTVVDPGERSLSLGYGGAFPTTEVLVREPGASFYVGRWNAGFDPLRVTLAVTFHAETHVGILGFHFGEHLGIGLRTPMVGFVAARHWAPSVSARVGFGVGVRERVSVNVHERIDVHEHVNVNVHERVDVHEHVNVHENEHGGGHEGEHGGGHEGEHGGGHGSEHGGGHGSEHSSRPASHGSEHSSHPASHGGGKRH